MQQPRKSKENVEQQKDRCRIHECSFQYAATEKEEADANQRGLAHVEENVKMSLETPAAEDLEILKLVALFSKKLIDSKNDSNLSKSLLPLPVFFRRRKLASLNCPAECKN